MRGFHLGNGLVSLASNPLLTWMFVTWAGLPLLPANLAAIACAAAINFAIAETWVFGVTGRPAAASSKYDETAAWQ